MSSEMSDTTMPSPVRTPTRERAGRHSLSVVLGALVLGALGGFAAAAAVAAHRRASTAVEPAEMASATPLSHDDWLAKAAALAGTPDAPDPALHEELARALAASPRLRDPVLERYAREPDRHHRGVLRELLVSAPDPGLARRPGQPPASRRPHSTPCCRDATARAPRWPAPRSSVGPWSSSRRPRARASRFAERRRSIDHGAA